MNLSGIVTLVGMAGLGCASVSPEPGHDQVSALVKQRTGRRFINLVMLLLAGLSCAANRGVPASMLGWNQAVPPFRVAGNIYYVGTNEMALFLIATPAGHILLDSGFPIRRRQDSARQSRAH